MKSIIRKKLADDLAAFSRTNSQMLNVEAKSFNAGYTNGFVRGFYFGRNWFFIPLIAAIVIGAATAYVHGFDIGFLVVLTVSFISFVAGASRERTLTNMESPDFKSRAIQALEEQIIKDAKTNADDSHRYAYEESIRIIKELK